MACQLLMFIILNLSSNFTTISDSNIMNETHSLQNETETRESRTATGKFTLLLFASASSYTGTDTLTLPSMNLKQLCEHLEQQYPGIGAKILRSSGVCVNLEYVEFEYDGLMQGRKGCGEDVVIKGGDEVGIIPPVSSG
ncbi:hypothetical protein BT93_L4467 [Corymbia citriodora subsp. variegata]|uniref:Molybdopterin synthase sulfur carrier subunit n=1 Tax=Corymbia citriodora subsp. variegata TaxID=360336 RepID=A0A8T0CGY3_CORYI|nr:hypothetical protein BT93_L4467 [Corymbia citriodora subsp. variegata]